jgi:hypothetical protein
MITRLLFAFCFSRGVRGDPWEIFNKYPRDESLTHSSLLRS